MKRIIIIILAVLSFNWTAFAQTPVESLISKYEDYKGVKVFVAEGAVMSMARGYIRKSPMGPLADCVDAITIMMMKKVTDDTKQSFAQDLRKTLKSYQFYGKKEGMDKSIVEVYGSPIKNGVVHELIVFNPEKYSLFSLRGSYSVAELKELAPTK